MAHMEVIVTLGKEEMRVDVKKTLVVFFCLCQHDECLRRLIAFFFSSLNAKYFYLVLAFPRTGVTKDYTAWFDLGSGTYQ